MSIIRTILFLSIFSMSLSGQSNLYWINRDGGDFQDPANWSKTSGGSGGQGVPEDDKIMIFDNNSGLDLDDFVVFQQGTHEVYSIIVNASNPFNFEFQGVSTTNDVDIHVYGDVQILPSEMKMIYNSTATNTNTWWFLGSNISHMINTGEADMNDVIMNGSNANFVQFSDLFAETRLRLEQGTWSTKGYEVRTNGLIHFRDSQSQANTYPKVFNTDGSNIYCKRYDAKLSYDMIVNGSHTIYVEWFDGNPPNIQPAANYDKIHLLDFEPPLIGSLDGVSHFNVNNLDCVECTVNSVVVEDVNVTKIRRAITIKSMTIQNPSSEILINGFNCSGLCENYITVDGSITGPALGSCNSRVTMKPIGSTTMSVRTGSMNALITRVDLISMPTEGPGTFTLSSAIATEGSSGWTINNPVASEVYKWRSILSSTAWNDWKNWDGPEGCIPTLNDDVLIDNESAPGTISLPTDTEALCRNLFWTKNDEEILMQMNSDLKINGNLTVDKLATFSGMHSIELVGSGNVEIDALSLLPKLEFLAPGSSYYLLSPLNASSLLFDGGNFHTNNEDIQAGSWGINEFQASNPTNYYLGSSEIDIEGEIKFAKSDGANHIIDAGSSHIFCGSFSSLDQYDFYDLTLRNSSTFTFSPHLFTFRQLELNGAKVRVAQDLEVDEVVFTNDGAELEINSARELVVNISISSTTSLSNPAKLNSSVAGNQIPVNKPEGNLCISGFIDLKDLNVTSEAVVHAPDANDLGNNSGIDFTDIPTDQNLPLYWTGNTSTNWAVRSNWSTMSGGCSTNFNPNNRPTLIFDENSLFVDNRVILYSLTATNQIKFVNVIIDNTGLNDDPLIFDNRVGLMLDEMTFDDSYIEFIGEDIDVNGDLIIENGSVLDIGVDRFKMNSLSIPPPSGINSLLIVRPGSQLIDE